MTASPAGGKTPGMVKNVLDTDEVLEALSNAIGGVLPDVIGSTLEGLLEMKSASGLSIKEAIEQLQVRIPMAAVMAGQAKKQLNSMWRTPPIPPTPENGGSAEIPPVETDRLKEQKRKADEKPATPVSREPEDALGFNEQASDSPLPEGSRPMEDLYPPVSKEEEARRAVELAREKNEHRTAENRPPDAPPDAQTEPETTEQPPSLRDRVFNAIKWKKDEETKQGTDPRGQAPKQLPNYELLLMLAMSQDLLGIVLIFLDGGLTASLTNALISGAMWFLLKDFQDELDAYEANKKEKKGNNTIMKRFFKRMGLEFIPVINAIPMYTIFILSLNKKVQSGELTASTSQSKKSEQRTTKQKHK